MDRIAWITSNDVGKIYNKIETYRGKTRNCPFGDIDFYNAVQQLNRWVICKTVDGRSEAAVITSVLCSLGSSAFARGAGAGCDYISPTGSRDYRTTPTQMETFRKPVEYLTSRIRVISGLRPPDHCKSGWKDDYQLYFTLTSSPKALAKCCMTANAGI